MLFEFFEAKFTVHVAWISSDYFRVVITGENDLKQSDEFHAKFTESKSELSLVFVLAGLRHSLESAFKYLQMGLKPIFFFYIFR